MSIRAIRKDDFDQLQRIHEKYFANEFSFPDFLTKYLCAFVIETDGIIIAAGGIRTIAEAIMITNKDVDIHDRRLAFYDLLTALVHVAKLNGYDQVHAFIQDPNWKRHLIHNNFVPTVGESLVLEI